MKSRIKTLRLSPRSKETGFTLIELMIVVAILGILLSIALPAYRQNVVKTRRTDVQQIIEAHAQALERYYSTNGRYVTTATGTTCGATAPSDTSNYTFSVTCAANTFSITSTPVVGSMQAADGAQSLSSSGARTGTWAK
ncbi:type IV pilin protein [Undibacterium sp. Ren11W]|uniref:type IV pilin protein n=1 Tax=Undibacterium sp. Ren11W TaxID=3413045 RepID=UPI003BF10DA7